MSDIKVPEQLSVRLVPANVKAFVYKVMNQYHPELDVNRFLVAFSLKEMVTKGKRALAKISVASPVANLAFAAGTSNVGGEAKEGMNRMLDFFLVIDQDAWYQLTEEEQSALIDHELCHAMYNEDDKPKTVAHDFEEFQDVVERHGPWTLALSKLSETLCTKPNDAQMVEVLKTAEKKAGE